MIGAVPSFVAPSEKETFPVGTGDPAGGVITAINCSGAPDSGFFGIASAIVGVSGPGEVFRKICAETPRTDTPGEGTMLLAALIEMMSGRLSELKSAVRI